MALNFPDSPVAGTVFGAWRYDGTKWGAVSGVSGGGSAGDITAVLAGAGLSGGGTEGDVSIALAVPVTVARGGTGATDAATALGNLGGAPLASPTFTGDPKAPSPATSDNDTSIATTAYVKAQGYLTPPVNLASQVTGTLPVANGGTGATTGPVGPYLPLVGGTLSGTLAVGSNAVPSLARTGNYTALYAPDAAAGVGTDRAILIGNGTAGHMLFRANNSVFVFQPATGGADIVAISPGTINVTAVGTASASLVTQNGSRSWSAGTMLTDNYVVYDNTGGAARIQITTAGACWNQTGTWSAMSDERTKRDVQPYRTPADSLARVNGLEPVMFKYNGAYGTVDDDQQMYGLIAQQVQPVLPELVTARSVDETEVLGVDSGRLIYALVNAVKALTARVEALEAPPA